MGSTEFDISAQSRLGARDRAWVNWLGRAFAALLLFAWLLMIGPLLF
jgi:hypothetical protein